MTPEFWNGRRVLVTGHTGFKGSWLSLWLQRSGARVSGFSLPPATEPSLFRLAGVGEGMASVMGDVRDPHALEAVMAEQRPEVVIHMAAQPLVRESYRNPVETYATNVMGTVHLLQSVRQVPGVRAVVVVTSDKCYENREWVWGYRETEPMGGFDPYSSSKGCAELVTSAYRRSFFQGGAGDRPAAAIASARAGNVIGGGDWAADRLIPDIVQAFAAERPAVIRNPGAVRPWQHVLEPLAGYLVLAERLARGDAGLDDGWNFGADDAGSRPVHWIAERMAALWGEGARWVRREAAGDGHEAHSLKLDCSKARALLGWQPRLSLQEALAWTVDWYRAHQAGREMREVTLGQIERYEALLPPSRQTWEHENRNQQ